MEVRKVKCLYHPNEVITNFCRDSILPSIKKIVLCLFVPVVLAIILLLMNKSNLNLPISIFIKSFQKSKMGYTTSFTLWRKTRKETYIKNYID